MKPIKAKGSIRLTSSSIKNSLVNAFTSSSSSSSSSAAAAASSSDRKTVSALDLDDNLKHSTSSSTLPRHSHHHHKVSLDPLTRKPTLMRDASSEVVFANPLAMLHVSMQELDQDDDLDDTAPSPTSNIHQKGAFTGYTPAEIKLFQSINIEESDSEDEEEHTKANNEAFAKREQELSQYRDLFLQQQAAAVTEEVDEPSPEPEETVAASSPSPSPSPSPTPSPPKKPSLQAAARAIIAGNRLVDALTADVETKSKAKKVVDSVESVEASVNKQHLQDTISKSKTLKIKQRQSLFGVTSAFLVAYRSKGSVEEVETVEESKKRIISTGSIPALIDAFTTTDDLDMEYLLEFLATHRFFMTSIKLLQHLINRHNELNQMEEETPESRTRKQVRILKVFRIWLARHPTDFGADSILERSLLSFIRLEVPETPQHQAEVDGLLSLIEQKNATPQKEAAAPNPSPPKRLQAKRSILQPEFMEELGPDVVGDQLALMEARMFKAIPEIEFHNFIKKNSKPTPNLTNFINWNYNFQSWIARLIVLADDSKERVEIVKYYIKLAKYCYQIKNYNTLFEVVEALSLPPIQRLVKTWRSLPTKYKASWLELLDIVSPSDNYALYRELLRNSQGNELPSFSVYLHDLEAAMDGMPTETADSRINFYKFHVIGGVLINIAYATLYQCKFTMTPNEEVQHEFQAISAMALTDSFVAKARELGSKGLFDKPAHLEPMFGVDLVEVTEKFGVFADKTRGMVPVVLRDIVRNLTDEKLSTDGLFRRPGNHLAMMRLKKEIDTTNKTDCLKDAMPLDLAGLFAHFLKELPDPLFTGRLYKQFLAVTKLNSTEERVQASRMLFTLLPEAHRDTALFVLKFLKKVSGFVKNKMHAKNLAVVFAPSLFGKTKNAFGSNMNSGNTLKLGKGATLEIEKTVRQHAQASIILEIMIEHQAELGHALHTDALIDYSRPDGKTSELGAI